MWNLWPSIVHRLTAHLAGSPPDIIKNISDFQKIFWITGELGDVLGRGPGYVGAALVVDLLHVHRELSELGDHQLAPECLGDEDVALLQKPAVTVSVNPSWNFCDDKVVY